VSLHVRNTGLLAAAIISVVAMTWFLTALLHGVDDFRRNGLMGQGPTETELNSFQHQCTNSAVYQGLHPDSPAFVRDVNRCVELRSASRR
jgi:hypothetical protein